MRGRVLPIKVYAFDSSALLLGHWSTLQPLPNVLCGRECLLAKTYKVAREVNNGPTFGLQSTVHMCCYHWPSPIFGLPMTITHCRIWIPSHLGVNLYYYVNSVQVIIIHAGGEDHRQPLHRQFLPQQSTFLPIFPEAPDYINFRLITYFSSNTSQYMHTPRLLLRDTFAVSYHNYKSGTVKAQALMNLNSEITVQKPELKLHSDYLVILMRSMPPEYDVLLDVLNTKEDLECDETL